VLPLSFILITLKRMKLPQAASNCGTVKCLSKHS